MSVRDFSTALKGGTDETDEQVCLALLNHVQDHALVDLSLVPGQARPGCIAASTARVPLPPVSLCSLYLCTCYILYTCSHFTHTYTLTHGT